MKNKIKISFKKILMLILPWRDSLGFYIGSIPIRLGEVILAGFIPKAFSWGKKIKKSEASILIILLLNFGFALLGVCSNTGNIDRVFATKYLLRNLFYIFVILGFLKSNLIMTENEIDRLMNYVVKLEFALLILTELTGLHFIIGGIAGRSHIEESGQYILLGSFKIARFMGTASEPGYLTPIILPVLYYYINKYVMIRGERKKGTILNISLILLCIAFTFSGAVYLLTAAIVGIVILGNLNKEKTRKIILYIFAVIAMSIPLVIKYGKILYIMVINKINYYLGRNAAFDWSAADRQQHLHNAWQMFLHSDFLHKIFGNGTGAYLANSKSNTDLLMTDVDEAYNLFLSTLTDRGVVGLLLLALLFCYLCKFIIKKDIYSTTLFSGIVIQYVYWMLTGNMWLYFFWINIIVLIGYFRYKKRCAS